MTESCLRVPADDLRALVADLFETVETSRQDAALMARLLVETDMRGVFSHGTKHGPDYMRRMRDGSVNPRPSIRVVSETRTTQVLDGDGGLGHFPCHQGARWAVATAKEFGTAAVTTRNHFHFGGAGKYTRIALEQDCIGLAVSSHRIQLNPDATVLGASGGSPISIAFPAGDEPTLVLDTGCRLMNSRKRWIATCVRPTACGPCRDWSEPNCVAAGNVSEIMPATASRLPQRTSRSWRRSARSWASKPLSPSMSTAASNST